MQLERMPSISGQPPSLHTPDQPTLNLLHAMERNNVQGMQLQIISCLGFSVRPQGEQIIFHLNTEIIKLENAVFFQVLCAEFHVQLNFKLLISEYTLKHPKILQDLECEVKLMSV